MIKLENVYKFYQIERHLKVVLDYVNVNFQPGRSYGILGVNGAGKSTLIRLIAGMELPNSGRLRRTGRISWPLGFSGGLHPKMTGRDNIKFAARIYGEYIPSVIDFVVDFAELGPYIDAPVITYSSGMQARLSFGLSMAIDFECYLIDEVMAVGDERFRRRCEIEFRRRKRHSDIIMVSHDMGSIMEYCDYGGVLARGKLHMFDNVPGAIELYKKLNA